MKKKFYEQPRTEAVELRVTNQLLAGSSTGSLEDYNWNSGTEESQILNMDEDFILNF